MANGKHDVADLNHNLGGRADSVVILHDGRVEVLEEIAKSYLLELCHAREQAKIAVLTGALQHNETPTTLKAKVCDLQARVDSLISKMESVGAL